MGDATKQCITIVLVTFILFERVKRAKPTHLRYRLLSTFCADGMECCCSAQCSSILLKKISTILILNDGFLD